MIKEMVGSLSKRLACGRKMDEEDFEEHCCGHFAQPN